MNEWFIGLATKKYPTYTSITRAIRKARELNPQWKKTINKNKMKYPTSK